MEKLNPLIIYSKFCQIKGTITSTIDDKILLDLENESIPNSIIIWDKSIIPFSYTSNKKENTLVKVNTEYGIYTGLLKYVNDKIIKIEINGNIKTIRNYLSIDYLEKCNQLMVHGVNNFNFLYLSSSLFWNPEYSIHFTKDLKNKEVITMMLYAKINSSMIKYKNKLHKIKLVLDHESNNNNNKIMALSQESDKLNNNISYNENEHNSYIIESPILLNGDLNVINLSTKIIMADKFYLYEIGSKNTKFGYSFNTEIYLPGGNINIYTNEEYIGKSSIKQSMEDEEVELIIGSSSKIKVISEISEINKEVENTKIDNKETTNQTIINIKNKIINNTNSDVLLILRYYKYNKTLINYENIQGIIIKDDYVDIYLKVIDNISYYDYTLNLTS